MLTGHVLQEMSHCPGVHPGLKVSPPNQNLLYWCMEQVCCLGLNVKPTVARKTLLGVTTNPAFSLRHGLRFPMRPYH